MSRPRDGFENWFVEEGPANRMILSLRSPLPHEIDWALSRLCMASTDFNERFNLEKWPGSVDALLEYPLQLVTFAANEPARWGEAVWEFASMEQREVQRRATESLLVLRNAGLNEIMNGKVLGRSYKLRGFIESFLALPETVLIDHLTEPLLLVLDIAHNLVSATQSEVILPPGIATALIPLLRVKDLAILTATFRLILALTAPVHWPSSRDLANPTPNPLDPHPNVHIRPPLVPHAHNVVGLAVSLAVDLLILPAEDIGELRPLALDILYTHTSTPSHAAVILRRPDVGGVLRMLAKGLYEGVEEVEGGETRPSPQEIMAMCPIAEPARSQIWLKRHFLAAGQDSFITQVSLWHAYRATFAVAPNGYNGPPMPPLLAAADIIKNISEAIPGASPFVTQTVPPQFIIKGVRECGAELPPPPVVYKANPASSPAPSPPSWLNQRRPITRLRMPLDRESGLPAGSPFTTALVLRNLARALVDLLSEGGGGGNGNDEEKEKKLRDGELFGLPIPETLMLPAQHHPTSSSFMSNNTNGTTNGGEVIRPEREIQLTEKEGERARAALLAIEESILDWAARNQPAQPLTTVGSDGGVSWFADVLECIATLEQ